MVWGCEYNAWNWGASSCGITASYIQGTREHAKQDTYFLGYNDSGSLQTYLIADVSQYLTSLSNGPNGSLLELASSRTQLDGRTGEVSARFAATDTTTGTIVFRGTTGSMWSDVNYRARIESGSIDLHYGDAHVLTHAMETIDAATRSFAMNWSWRKNKVGSESSNEYLRHELTIYDYESGSYEASFGLSAQAVPDVAQDFQIGGVGSSDTLTTVDNISRVRISEDYHSMVEFSEDYVGLSTKPVHESSGKFEPLWFDRASGFGNETEYFGPVPQQESIVREQMRWRLVSPLLNENHFSPFSGSLFFDGDALTGDYWLDTGDGWKALAQHLRWCQVHEGSPVGRIYFELGIKNRTTSGATPSTMSVRFYSMDLPWSYSGLKQALNDDIGLPTRFYKEIDLTGHSSGIVSGTLPISVVESANTIIDSTTYLCPVFSASENSRFALDSMYAIQTNITASGGGGGGLNWDGG